jgi:hypothetical protein
MKLGSHGGWDVWYDVAGDDIFDALRDGVASMRG